MVYEYLLYGAAAAIVILGLGAGIYWLIQQRGPEKQQVTNWESTREDHDQRRRAPDAGHRGGSIEEPERSRATMADSMGPDRPHSDPDPGGSIEEAERDRTQTAPSSPPRPEPDRTPEADADDGDEAGEVVAMQPLEVRTASFGTLQELWRIWRVHRKRRKYAAKGYVQWILISDNYPVPKFVKPTLQGGGQLELKHDGQRYLFPRKAMLPSSQHGIRTIIHKEGDAKPINLDMPGEPSIPADELQEYLELRVTSSPPSFWDRFDLDVQDLLTYGVLAIIGYAILSQFLGGGIV